MKEKKNEEKNYLKRNRWEVPLEKSWELLLTLPSCNVLMHWAPKPGEGRSSLTRSRRKDATHPPHTHPPLGHPASLQMPPGATQQSGELPTAAGSERVNSGSFRTRQDVNSSSPTHMHPCTGRPGRAAHKGHTETLSPASASSLTLRGCNCNSYIFSKERIREALGANVLRQLNHGRW